MQQADCYLYVLELTKKKLEEKVVIPAIKGWLENKIRRKQEWIILVVVHIGESIDNPEKVVRKACDKVRAAVGVKDERRVVKLVGMRTEERDEVIQSMRGLVG